MHRFKAILLAAALCFGLASAAQAQYTEQWGGLKDSNSELVWRLPVGAGSGSQSWCASYASGYSVLITDPDSGAVVNYDDWRLPTVAEMQQFAANKELADRLFSATITPDAGEPPAGLEYESNTWAYWTGDSAGGSKGWLIDLEFALLWADGVTYDIQVVGSGQPWSYQANFAYAPFLMVRSGATPAPPTKGGGKKK